MIEFGKSLRAAREAKGLTVAQIAETTHIAPTTINELETEDFSRIAAPIYGRGFVKLYCEAVGLDPKAYVAEFMEIYNGNHDTGIKERLVPAAAPEEPAAPVEPTLPEKADLPSDIPQDTSDIAEEPPIRNFTASRQQDLFGNEIPEPPRRKSSQATAGDFASLDIAPQKEPVCDEPPVPTGHEHDFSRYAEPLRQLKPLVHSPLWRMSVIAVAALVLFVLLVLGIRAIYRATSVVPVAATSPSKTSLPPAKASAKTSAQTPDKTPNAAPASVKTPAATTRTPQQIPALYVD